MTTQTDPELVLDINFLRKTKQSIVRGNHPHHQNQNDLVSV